MTGHHLAQINIAKLKALEGDPSNAFFFDNLVRVNTLAEQSEGFVWRLQDEAGDATSISAFDDPMLLINISVWESVEALKKFAFNTIHKKIFERREEFFEPLGRPHATMWWIPKGNLPSFEEAKEKLELLEKEGPTPAAFTFAEAFPPPAE